MRPADRSPLEPPCGRTARGSAAVPPSKSLTHRALILSGLARGTSRIIGALDSGDTRATREALASCGAAYSGPWEDLSVAGIGGALRSGGAPLLCGDSGTTLRLFMGLCGGCHGRFVLEASAQLRRRPVGGLGDALEKAGVSVSYLASEGCAPVRIEGHPWDLSSLEADGSLSSQFVSGLLLGALFARRPVEIHARGLVSRPYAEMTVSCMDAFGASVSRSGPDAWTVSPGPPRARAFRVEPDASSASYFLAAAAVTGGEVRVEGIRRSMVQGDAAFVGLMERFGAAVEEDDRGVTVRGGPLMGIEADVSDIPDLMPTLGAVALFAEGPSRFTGAAHLRYKESDRLSAVAEAIRALGGEADAGDDALTIRPAPDYRGTHLDPRGDHRMAMATAVMAARIPGIRIADPDCVSKSFPGFWREWERLFG